MSTILRKNMTGTASATLSNCDAYRYRLTRRWFAGSGVVNFIMLNPSTADALRDDPTIRRCVDFAKRWGFEKLVVTNVFGLRSTDPKLLLAHADPYGPDNHRFLHAAAKSAQLVLCAWGNHGTLRGGARGVLALLANSGVTPHCLKRSKSGQPAHPLYLRSDLEPIPYPVGDGP